MIIKPICIITEQGITNLKYNVIQVLDEGGTSHAGGTTYISNQDIAVATGVVGVVTGGMALNSQVVKKVITFAPHYQWTFLILSYLHR